MAIKKPEMILIDLDGTLVDSVPDLAWCVDEMMKALNMPVRGQDKVRNWVGNGVTKLIERALVDQLDGAPSDELFARAAPIFMDLYTDNASKRSQLYPAVKDGLKWLIDQGIRVGCVTNKDEKFTLKILKDLGLYDFFEIIISGDTLPLKKPHPAPLLHGAKFFGIAPEKAMMIGDSISDVKASRAAGFSIVCMSYGYNHGVDIRTANPDVVIDSFAELQNVIDGD
jgi:phosphoglycolate phosphatase